MKGFPAAARESLQDSQLRRNLGKATQTIRAKRLRTIQELPDWEQLREAGAAIKARAMATLPEQLERLEAAVTRAGGTVHWARDGAEATAIVARIAEGKGAREVIKVKSLATDEIDLNEGLHARGIEAIETDLAELIIQLADDKQSHILVPAIHWNRAEIKALFERTIAQGEDLGWEATAIAEAARRHLREKFLTVPVAVSGANFGIAETGTICVVESEGNGRMCTTLPETLITVMGIEKVLPEWRDLEVFLALLPRSSTAERMNPYTSLWTGVREQRRPAGVPPRPARQRPHPRARRRGRPPGAALHPLLGVPERVPGLRARGRAGLRVRVSRPDRRDPDAAAARPRPGADAAVGLVAVRRLLRGVPGQDRHPVRAGAPPRARGAGGEVELLAGGARDARGGQDVRLAPRLRARPAALQARPRPAGEGRRCRAGARCASCPWCPSRRSGSGGGERRAG